jgi:hypothetical protein
VTTLLDDILTSGDVQRCTSKTILVDLLTMLQEVCSSRSAIINIYDEPRIYGASKEHGHKKTPATTNKYRLLFTTNLHVE